MSVDLPMLGGRYRVLRRLGRGGSAIVYLAEDERLGRRVAVKRLHADSPEDMARRFEREARLGASLSHPNVVAVFDTATDDEGVLIVQEYVEGTTLAEALRSGPLERGRALAVVDGIAAALDHAHRHGILHRDVKPANVLLGRNGAVKLADLGIARATEAAPLTRTGTVLGTPAYMAPEQFEGGGATSATDVYSLAAVAFEVLSGRRARSGATPLEVAHRAVAEPPPDVRDAWPDAPPEVADVLARGMAREPAERPESAGELARALRAALETPGREAVVAPAAAPMAEPAPEPAAVPEQERSRRRPEPEPAGAPAAPPPEPRPAPRRRRPWALAGLLAVLVALGAAAAVIATRDAGPVAERGATEAGGREDARGGERAEPGGARPGASAPGAAPEPEGGGPRAGSESSGGGGGASGREAAPDEAAPAGADSPEAAVRGFYERAAADDFEGAWALAGPGFRSQLGGFESFRAALGTLESIEFTRLDLVERSADSSTVAVRTRATHESRVDSCSGSLETARSSGGWLVESGDVRCTRASGGSS